MTLPASGLISLSDVLTELQKANGSRALPISLGDADVLALAGKSAPPISLSDLYGKSSYTPMIVTPQNAYGSGYSGTAGGVASATASVSIAGGSGGNTFAWSFASNPGGLTFSGQTNGPFCGVKKSFVKNSQGSFPAQLQCVITDNTGHVVTAYADAVIDIDF